MAQQENKNDNQKTHRMKVRYVPPNNQQEDNKEAETPRGDEEAYMMHIFMCQICQQQKNIKNIEEVSRGRAMAICGGCSQQMALVSEVTNKVKAQKEGELLDFLKQIGAEWRNLTFIGAAEQKLEDKTDIIKMKIRQLREQMTDLFAQDEEIKGYEDFEGIEEEWEDFNQRDFKNPNTAKK